MARLPDVILRDTRANQPAIAGVAPGTIYYVTDEQVTERAADDLSTWEDISDAGTATPAINQLTGDVTAGPGSGSQAATIAASAVTNAKMANMADQTIKGNDSGGAAAPQDLSANEVSVVLDGATDPFVRTSALPPDTGITQLTGDVTAGPGSGSQGATIPAGTVTFAKMQAITTNRLLGADTGTAIEEIPVANGLEFDGGPGLRQTVAARTRQIGITVDGGGSVITTGVKGFKSFPVAGTLTAWRLMADASGNADFTVKKDAYPPPPTTSILTPSLSGAQSTEATGLSQGVTAGDVFSFTIGGTPATITRVTLELTIVVTG